MPMVERLGGYRFGQIILTSNPIYTGVLVCRARDSICYDMVRGVLAELTLRDTLDSGLRRGMRFRN